MSDGISAGHSFGREVKLDPLAGLKLKAVRKCERCGKRRQVRNLKTVWSVAFGTPKVVYQEHYPQDFCR